MVVVASSLGREVGLRPQTWRRIVNKHPEIRNRVLDVIQAIESGEHRFRDARHPRREHFYGSRAFRRGWLRVIVDFSEDPAIIIHAMRVHLLPTDLERL